MEFPFQCWGIVIHDHRMDIISERYTGISEFPYPVERFEAARQANLKHLFPKRTDIRDDVDMSLLGLLRHGEGTLIFLFRLF